MYRLRILVVEDEPSIRDGLRALLEREGYDVQTAGDAWGAVRWIKRAPFDCLLIDKDLTRDNDQGVNGLDIIALLRVHQPKAKAILMSACTDPGLAQLAWARGAVAQLEKPFEPVSLTRLLRTLFPGNRPTAPHSSVLCPSG